MLKLNVLKLLEDKNMSKYKLYNKLNSIRSITQVNKSVLYQDLDELCEALDCDIADLIIRIK